jgi:hypothetical protein
MAIDDETDTGRMEQAMFAARLPALTVFCGEADGRRVTMFSRPVGGDLLVARSAVPLRKVLDHCRSAAVEVVDRCPGCSEGDQLYELRPETPDGEAALLALLKGAAVSPAKARRRSRASGPPAGQASVAS